MAYQLLSPAIMDAVQTENKPKNGVVSKQTFRFPHGIMGFENIKNYCLLDKEEDGPFWWLQMLEDPELSFLLIPSQVGFPNYKPDFSREDLDLLKIENFESLMLFQVVTVHPDGRATANLKGPIILNRDNQMGAQFVVKNAVEYAVDAPLGE